MSTQIIMYYIALDGLQGPGIQLLWLPKRLRKLMSERSGKSIFLDIIPCTFPFYSHIFSL